MESASQPDTLSKSVSRPDRTETPSNIVISTSAYESLRNTSLVWHKRTNDMDWQKLTNKYANARKESCEKQKVEEADQTIPKIKDVNYPPGTCLMYNMFKCPKRLCNATSLDPNSLYLDPDADSSQFRQIDLSNTPNDQKGDGCFGKKTLADTICGKYNVTFYKNKDNSWTNDKRCIDSTTSKCETKYVNELDIRIAFVPTTDAAAPLT